MASARGVDEERIVLVVLSSNKWVVCDLASDPMATFLWECLKYIFNIISIAPPIPLKLSFLSKGQTIIDLV